MEDIKISIIIPCYNAENFIEKCINSVLNQTLEEIEVIVINDGSTDNSLEKINQFKINKKVKIIDQNNEGSSKTRNKGLSLAKGEYVYFVDADDYLENNFVLEKVYRIAKEENLDILIFDYYKEYKTQKKYIENFDGKEKIELSKKKKHLKELLEEKYWGIIWNKLVKKELYLNNNIFFPENIFIKEDLLTVIKLIYSAKKIKKINEAFYNYVQHESQGTKTINKNKMYLDYYNGYLDLENYFLDKKDSEIIELINIAKRNLYYEVIKSKNKKLEIYRELKKEAKKEKIKFNNEWNVIKKIKFLWRIYF